jgi:hypothetical protein
MVQATDNPTPKFTTETLSAISAKLSDLADVTLASRDTQTALRWAATAIDKFVLLMLTINAIAQKAVDHPEWDNASIARDLRDALTATEEA